MKKVVINICFGGFSLSRHALTEYAARKGHTLYFNKLSEYSEIAYTSPDFSEISYFSNYDVERDDPDLIAVIEQYGEEICSGGHARLKIVEIPDDVEFVIEEYDGSEHIAEKHRTWA